MGEGAVVRVDLDYVHGVCFFKETPVCAPSLPDTASLIGLTEDEFWATFKEKFPQHYGAGLEARGFSGHSQDVSRTYHDRYSYE